MRSLFTLLVLAAVMVTPARAQLQDNRTQELDCSRQRGQERFCEIREETVNATGSFEVDGLHNGAITVKGWNRNDVLVRSRVSARASSDRNAEDLARQVQTRVTAGRLRVDGPDLDSGFFEFLSNGFRDQGWSVSVEIFVPHETNLEVRTHNGAISLMDVTGDIEFGSHNGAVRLERVAGDISGETHNGAIVVELAAGVERAGSRLGVETHNGGVTLALPENYSAHVRANTHNGGIDSEFPITVTGRIDRRRMEFDLGSGGPSGRPMIALSTHNGGIRLRRL